MSKVRVHKRHAILLEVLIAFALVALCALPLVYSHAYILRAEQEFIQKIKLDHVVNLLYADFYERLQTNEFPWDAFINKHPLPIDPVLLKQLNGDQAFPYEGMYYFEIMKHKPKGKDEPFTLNLLKLHFSFISKSVLKTYEYEYLIFAARRLGGEEPPSPPQATPPGPKDPSAGSFSNKNFPTPTPIED